MRLRPRGLTLAEVLIAMGVMTVLTGLLVGIYSSSYSAFRRGTSRMEVQQRAREVVRRVTPLVMSSKAPSPLEEAVLHPPVGETSPTLDMYTADNLLVPMEAVLSRFPPHYLFRIWLDPTERTVRIDELNKSTLALTGRHRILAFNVQELSFERLAVNLVKLEVTTRAQVRAASNNLEDLDVVRSAVIAIPYYSSTR